MSLTPILIIIGFTIAIGILARGSLRGWALMVSSILVIYWLQPTTPIRNLDFWLPTISLGLAILVWSVSVPKETINIRLNLIIGSVIAVVVLLIGFLRYLAPICCLTPSKPPQIYQIAFALALLAIFSTFLFYKKNGFRGWLHAFTIIIIGILVILKFEPLARLLSMGLKFINSQSVQLATGVDIRWLGFSYVAFRLVHTLIDRLYGRLPELNLQEYVIYVIFYPAYTAGPIDRVQRFVRNLREPYQPTISKLIIGFKRIIIGIFNKFVIADGLAIFALSTINSEQILSSGWLWITLYAYAFRIYFDFAGYTDIAIGIGNLVGIELPENFDKPYLKPNLTLFWNSWHMTLANWFRAYYFNPLTRSMRSRGQAIPMPVIIFIGLLSTFILIGLWHGITWNFAIWGAWHGIGLFIHNRWSEYMRSKGSVNNQKPRSIPFNKIAGILITFNYVSFGWIWFALSSPAQSVNVFLKLFGLA